MAYVIGDLRLEIRKRIASELKVIAPVQIVAGLLFVPLALLGVV